ncbi:MAG: nucleotidyltransferase family protein [Steroidobacteraceae bacterium]
MDSSRAAPEGAPTLHSLVLAAGASTRFGSPKQLVRLQGRPLLHRAVSSAAAISGQAVTVVLGAHAAELAPLLRHSPAAVIVNRHWEEGIGSSIRAGVARLPASCDGVLILLADQAAVTVTDLERLCAAWRRDPLRIAASRYDSILGVPAVFPRSEFPELASLRGDRGARSLLRRRAPHLTAVELASASIDIDTPEDLLRLPSGQA